MTIRNLKDKIKLEWKRIIFNCVFAIMTIFPVIMFHQNIFLTTFILSIVSIFGLIKWKSKITFVIFIFSAFFGAVAEIFGVKFGVWQYAFFGKFGIPLWLYLVWGNTGAFLYQTAIEFKKLGVKK